MDLTRLTSQLKVKTNFNANSSLGLSDINGITGIVDNSVSSLQALIFSNRNAEYEDIDPTKLDVTGMTSGYDGKAFVFDLKKDYKFNLASDITDHYVESNIAIQDHIGLKPIILEVTGSIGEVTLSSSKGKTSNNIASEIGQNKSTPENKNIFNAIDSYLNRMGSLTSFAPNIVNQALNVYNTTKYGYATVNKIINLDKKDSTNKSGYDYTEGYNEETIEKTKQFYYIDWFKTQWWNRASFTIVTPYGVLDNMYIMDLNAVQPETTRYVTNLTIKFKQIRRAKILKQNRKVAQTMEVQNKEHGLLVRKDEYGNVIVDATQDMTDPMTNSNFSLSGSKVLSEGASYNVPPSSKNYTNIQLQIGLKSFGLDNMDAVEILKGK